MVLKTKLILGNKIFSAVSPADWDHLARGAITDTPFQTHAYQQAWWTNLGRGELVSAVVTDEFDQLVGLAVFLLEEGVLQFNASKEETDYLDIIVKAEQAEAVWSAVLDCLCTNQACPAWATLDCWNIPSESPSKSILPQLAQSRGFSFSFSLSEERAEVCPAIPLSETFDEYLAGINKKQRGEIRRKMKKAAEAGVSVQVIGAQDDLDLAIKDFLHLLQCSTPDKKGWLEELPTRGEVFHTVAKAALEAGTLLLMFTVIDGERISALFNFIYDGRVWVYNSGNDISKYPNLSLGWVLTAHAIQQGIERGCHTFDFLRGDETYKYRFGAKDTEIFRLTLKKEMAH
jgi:CelD/BcsL family acetyltransferase involved in cellulose biosynthesis